MKYFATKLSKNMAETPEGFLICLNVPIARVGEYEYGEGETPLKTDDNGIVVITRDEDEVFSEETIASFEGKAFTIKHPEEFVNPKNWSQLAKGVMQNVRRGEGENKDDLVADILITDDFAISLVKNGLRGLSCGYEAEYTQTGKGRGKQTKIVGNHLALVEEGRAGTSYAINDEKGVNMKNKTLAEKLKTLFGKAIDEATKDEEKPADKKDEKKSEDAAGYDELVKMVKDLSEKIGAMKPESKDEEESEGEDEEEAPAKKDKKDGEGEDDEASGMEERLKALEAAVAKILEKMQPEDEESEEESEDEDSEEESEDEPEVMATGDTASRAEILAPGIKANSKEIKVKALKAAYGTKDGKQVIDQLTGGKSPDYDKADKVETLFIAASELLKVSRNKELSSTKKTLDFQSVFDTQGPMTAEKMNELNAKIYNRK
jgi:hypothetical protein